ncbi:HD-GYP domain-containing protein [Caminicella sporogenes]|uniref:HD-GYP domain-containing protein n=1 Tax=Caminicella sporogenes TaxID=166485 RepID=UPI002540CFA4|nr:HD domain-containing phosphohydrolase [Caminicella sporogenes]WIF93981.1 HD domain-containing protein [Caminicella sporogenes]
MGFDKYFEPLKLDNIDKSLEFELRNFLIEKNISYCLFFSIINNMAVRIINIKKDENEEIQYNFSEFLNLDIQRENGIYKLITEKKSIINFQNSNIKTYVKGLKYEIYIPITFKDEIVGCIYLGANEGENLSLNLDVVEIYEIIKRHMFYIMDIKAEKILYKVLIENIILINKIFEEKTPFMTRHLYNVAAWAIQIARELNYSDERLTEIYLAALMHDIGKIYIDSEIVNKGDDLNEEEYEEAKKHVEIGYNIAKDILITFNAQIPIWILQHHERWDGTGYPNKLKGEEITEEARILKVANFLDKIISKSNYKNEKGKL